MSSYSIQHTSFLQLFFVKAVEFVIVSAFFIFLILFTFPLLSGLTTYQISVINAKVGSESKVFGNYVLSQKDGWYFPGDMIVFEKDGEIAADLILAKEMTTQGEKIILKNNNTNGTIGSIYPKSIIGKKIILIPLLAQLQSRLKTPFGITFLIIIPSLVYLAWEVKNFLQHVKVGSMLGVTHRTSI